MKKILNETGVFLIAVAVFLSALLWGIGVFPYKKFTSDKPVKPDLLIKYDMEGRADTDYIYLRPIKE